MSKSSKLVEAANVPFIKEFMGFIGTKGVDPESLNNDQELWRVLRMYEEETKQTLAKSEVRDLKDFFYAKAFREQANRDLWKVESKSKRENKLKEVAGMKKRSLSESALTDFTMNAQVEVEGLGSGKVILITPDSVSIRFADDSEKTFLVDELYNVTIKATEQEPEVAPVEVPAGEALPASDATASVEAVRKAVSKMIEAVKLIDSRVTAGFDTLEKKNSRIKESVMKLVEAVKLVSESDAAIASADPGEGGEGTPADDKGKIDQTPNVDKGQEIPNTPDPDKALSTPAAIAAESKKIAKKLGISVNEAFRRLQKAIVEQEEAGEEVKDAPETTTVEVPVVLNLDVKTDDKAEVAVEAAKVLKSKLLKISEEEEKASEEGKPETTTVEVPVVLTVDVTADTPAELAVESRRMFKKSKLSVKEGLSRIKKALTEQDVVGDPNPGDAGAGLPADDKDKIDQAPNVPAGTEVPATPDPDKTDTVPGPITQEAKRKAKLAKALDEMKALAGVTKRTLLG